jgi:hypothetical protein
MDDLKFPLDLMGGFREELARGLLAKDEFLSICCSEQVSRIRLAKTKL